MREYISYSEITTLQTCPRQHYYRYHKGLSRIGPVSPSLSRGTWVHHMLQEFFTQLRDNHDVQELNGWELDQLLEVRSRDSELILPEPGVRNESIGMFDSLLKSRDFVMPTEVLAVEQERQVDIGLKDPETSEPILFTFITDLEWLDQDGSLWVSDHKTAGRAWSEDKWMFNTQVPLYIRGLEVALEQPVMGATVNLMTPKAAISRSILNVPEQIDNILMDFQHTLYQRSIRSFNRSPGMHCSWCPFKDLCYADLMGSDTEQMVLEFFEVNEERREAFQED